VAFYFYKDTDDKGWSSSLGVGRRATIPHRKRQASYKMLHRALESEGPCEHGNEPSNLIKGCEFLD